MKFFKSLFNKTSQDGNGQTTKSENVVAAGALPPIDLARTTRPTTSEGNGEKKPRVSKLTMLMLLSDMSTRCLQYVKQHAVRGDAASVLACMNEFASTNHMMNIGEIKGKIVDEEIRKKKPAVMVELGAYTGYSAVRFASLQRELAGDHNSHYYSFEYSPVYAARVREIVEIAGLSDQVTVYEGPFSEQYEKLSGKQVDVYFIDHEKSVYLSDLNLILQSGTLVPGSVVAADNVVMPGAPDYLKFIESSPQFLEVRHTVHIKRENVDIPDLSIATFLG